MSDIDILKAETRGRYSFIMSPVPRKRCWPVFTALVLVCSLLAGPLAALAAPSWQVTAETEQVPLATGVRYSAYRLDAPEYNEALKVLTIDPNDRYTVLETALSRDNLARDLERPTAMAGRLAGPGKVPVAAANGDFYSTQPPYLPIGLQIRNGELLTNPEGFPALGLTRDKKVLIGTPVLAAELTVTREVATKGRSVARIVYNYPLTAINRPRLTDSLILYTPAYAASTETNQYGSELIIKGVDLPLRAGGTYSGTVVTRLDDRGNTPIPPDGLVLSGHGRAQEFLKQVNPGDRVSFTLKFTDTRWNEVIQAVGGHEFILQNGRVALPPASRDPLVATRHPRTAAGVTRDGRLEIIVADGRQPGYSNGMTLYELAEFMQARGIVTAINLDGGGSAVLAVRPAGENGLVITNKPSDGQERPVTNGLVLFSSAPRGKLSHLYLSPGSLKVYQGSRVEFKLKAQDNYYNPTPVPTDLTWQVGGSVGRFVYRGIFEATHPGQGVVTARTGEVQATAKVTVVDRIARLVLTPAAASLVPGASQQFTVTAYDAGGEEVLVDKSLYRWSVSPGLGRFDPGTGRLVCTGGVMEGVVKVSLGNQEAVATIKLAGPGVATGRVTASALYVRTGPGTSYQHVALLPRGTLVTILERLANGWLRVRLDDGREGFVYGLYVNLA